MNRRTLYVGGLSPATKLEPLRVMLEQFGLIEDIRMTTRRSSTGENPGIAYVTFKTSESAMAARRVLDGSELDGARIRVDIAR
ncbi:MAG: RNA-binding protein [Myxococcales bacterium]|nr:RNA-binding protein [Myxococcales bacterium]MCB9750355.1 RNA-binding protein [Myxococcales bacterium]